MAYPDYRFGSSTLEAPLVGATFTSMDISWAHEFRDGAAFKVTPFVRRGYNVIEQTAQILGFNYNTGQPVYGDVAYSNLGTQKAGGIELLYTKDVPYGLSMQIGATYISQFGNEPPGAFLQPAALAVGETYRLPNLSPLQLNAAFNCEYHNGWRINPVIGANVGYPFGADTIRRSTATVSPSSYRTRRSGRSSRKRRDISIHWIRVVHETEHRRDARRA